MNANEWNASDIFLADPDVPDSWKVCYINGAFDGNDYNGSLGARISSIFVIMVISTFVTIFPLLAIRFKRLKIPLYGYLFARYFGTGVIVATAFVHLMDPAYGEIGPNTCVGMTGNWASYSWPPAIILVSVFFIFLVDVISKVWVEQKYGAGASSHDSKIEDVIIREQQPVVDHEAHAHVHSDTDSPHSHDLKSKEDFNAYDNSITESETELDFRMQFSAFLILEFGVIFHSVMIGLNLGAVGDEFKTLYIVLVFHQSFEGLGIGSRLSAIPWPKNKPSWIPWACCIAYGLVTPVSIAIGLGVRTQYSSDSFNASIVLGVLDSISAGILIYTGLVELLARDFIFDDANTKDIKRLVFSLSCTIVGAGVMALLGKWA